MHMQHAHTHIHMHMPHALTHTQVERIISLVVLLSREEPLANHRVMMERGAV